MSFGSMMQVLVDAIVIEALEHLKKETFIYASASELLRKMVPGY